MKKTIKGYKAFDAGLKCRDFQFELGKDFTTDTKAEDLKTCQGGGFHFCESIGDVYDYYPFGSVIAEVEAFGDVVKDGNKSTTNGLRLLRILGAEKEARMNTGSENAGYLNSGDWNSGNRNSGNRNSGNWNSGDWNSGNWNSGNRNSGDLNSGNRNSGDLNSGNRNSGNWNSGNWNSGNWNSGNWNSGNRNSGDLNSGTPDYILVFNKRISTEKWGNTRKPSWMYFDLTLWVEFSDMTDEEKAKYPKASTCGGYLKTLTTHEAWKRAYDNASEEERKATKKLPNFNAKVFKEISGLDL